MSESPTSIPEFHPEIPDTEPPTQTLYDHYDRDKVLQGDSRDDRIEYSVNELDRILQQDHLRVASVEAANNIPGVNYESVEDMLDAATKILEHFRKA